ncbi:Acetolactate synthase large subunit (plasmid) [Variovorax sp. SRS16]|uniref:thiamine pyrophosphate-binding protein n=1 Tax=Variovorax sp. SRS16 TaxID=282217 RepID=UPI001316C7CF|nr:thiamine pyrophosphate-binding protein [Variovorax sp. SRS16]VTU45637.1 Acetolactate synthase large subunit [Variovorax sp. SRS16]
MSQYLVGDLAAEFLARCGIEAAFGVISVHNVPILDGIAQQRKLRFVMARGEMGAAHMADGYARAGGRLGALITSTGPGAANAASGLLEAGFAGSPVLHITGQTPTRSIGRGQGAVHDVADQLGMLKSLSKAAYRVNSPQEALGVLTRAAVDALSPRMGPVSVEIPFDIQRTAIARPAAFDRFVLPLPPRRVPQGEELDRLIEHVAKARRPMLWLGNGARHAGAAAARLLELGFGMVNSQAAQGIVSGDHPMNLGALNGSRHIRADPVVEALFDSCDLLLVAGSRLRVNETRDGQSRLPKNLVHIDLDPAANGRTYESELFVCGDSAATLDLLAQRLGDRLKIDPGFRRDVAAAKVEATADFTATLGPYAEFPTRLRAAMPRDAVWVRDVTLHNGAWGNKVFPIHGPHDGIYPIGLGIGQGLPLGIGAAVAANAAGRKVVMMAGDGGFAMNMTELWTAVQEKLDIVILVMNDGGYGVIKHIQDSLYEGRRHYGDLLSPDFGQLAQLAGMPFWKVRATRELGEMVGRAVAAKGPAMVEVDMSGIGEFPPYVVPAR